MLVFWSAGKKLEPLSRQQIIFVLMREALNDDPSFPLPLEKNPSPSFVQAFTASVVYRLNVGNDETWIEMTIFYLLSDKPKI